MGAKQGDCGAGPQPWTGFIERSVDHIPPAGRLDFWYQSTSKRMECHYAATDGRPVRARLQALVQANTEFIEYQSDAFLMRRDRRMCRADGRDEISIGLVLSPASGAIQDGTQMPLQRGDLYVIDFGRPVDSATLGHHELAIMLPRRLVAQAMGQATDTLGGRKLSSQGMGGLLASHMAAMAREARFLTPAQQRIALQAACDLALATLQDSRPGSALDMERFADGLYASACRTIETHCADHTFNAEKLAALLGCSRASLYRIFAGHEHSVSAAIWDARLDHARWMLQSPRHRNLSISDIAFRSGFLDLAAFSRMYKHRHGHPPREARAENPHRIPL